MPNQPLRIFISYSRHDLAKLEDLAKDLQEIGYEVWVDRSLTGGQPW